MGRPIMYWSEVRERAVRLVLEHRGEYRFGWAVVLFDRGEVRLCV